MDRLQLRAALPIAVLLAVLGGSALVGGQRLDGGVRLNGVTQGITINNPTFTGVASLADGAANAPSLTFTSETGLGIYRNSSLDLRIAGGGGDVFRFSAGNGFINSSAQYVAWGSSGVSTPDLQLTRGAAGRLNVTNAAGAIGSAIKVDALPTAGTCGTSPAVTAGSTPFAGSVNVGTGGTATSCTVTFNGTAFPSAPFCLATPTTTNAVTRASASTTVLTLASTTAWTASDVIQWICVSSK